MSELDKLQAEIARLKSRNSKLDERYGYEVGKNDELQAQVSDITSMWTDACARLAQAERWSGFYKSKWDESELELRECEKENGQLEARLTETEAAAQMWQDSCVEENDRNLVLHRRIEELEDTAYTDTLAKVVAERDQLREEVKDVQFHYANARAEIATLRQQLEALKPSIAGHTPNGDFTIEDLRKEVERLRAENKALKPKPDTYTESICLELNQEYLDTIEINRHDTHNLKLTFIDGKLHSAEVIG